MTAKKYTTKTNLAKEMSWPVGLVSDLLGGPDYYLRHPQPGYGDMAMYNIEQAVLFDGSPEVQWRKMRKTTKRIKPKDALLEQWKVGCIDDRKEATKWCIQQVGENNLNEAFEVAKNLDGHHRDIFYGLTRTMFDGAGLRKAIRELDMSGPALQRHIIKAMRHDSLAEALLLSSSPEFIRLNEPLHVEAAFTKNMMFLFDRFNDKFDWREKHAGVVERLAIRMVGRRRVDLLSKLPGELIGSENRSKLFVSFTERTLRDGAQDQAEEFLRWARGVWTDKDILATLVEVSPTLHGGARTRNVANFIKLFEKLAQEMPGFDKDHIKTMKRDIGADTEIRGRKFRSGVLKVQLDNISQKKYSTPQSPPPSKPKM